MPPVEKVTDYATIVGYGVMATPALVVDKKVVSTGRVLTPTHIGGAPQRRRRSLNAASGMSAGLFRSTTAGQGFPEDGHNRRASKAR